MCLTHKFSLIPHIRECVRSARGSASPSRPFSAQLIYPEVTAGRQSVRKVGAPAEEDGTQGETGSTRSFRPRRCCSWSTIDAAVKRQKFDAVITSPLRHARCGGGLCVGCRFSNKGPLERESINKMLNYGMGTVWHGAKLPTSMLNILVGQSVWGTLGDVGRLLNIQILENKCTWCTCVYIIPS